MRVVYDEDDDAYKKADESLYPKAIRATDNEVFPTLNDFLYSSDLYAHSEIGRDIYSYITLGTKNIVSAGISTLETLANSTDPAV